jgi:nucleotide-binding universal stress UspA family protein
MNANAEPRPETTVVVGVDGSPPNRSAVRWAQREAARLGARLVLVGATHEYAPPTPGFSSDYADELFEQEIRKTLENVRTDIGGIPEDMPIWIGRGGAQSVLLRVAERADLVVVGRRGRGAVPRMFVGSNSIAVAGRSLVPVAIVPEGWEENPGLSTAPIVVGLDRSDKDGEVLAYAFGRASTFKVPLLVVHAWLMPTIYTLSRDEISQWGRQVSEEFTHELRSWRTKFPDVEAVLITPDANPTMAILDAAQAAQLIVLGRHTGPKHLGGFSFGSTSRSVLHHATCPVMVIPSSTPYVEPEIDDADDFLPEF